jgi:hypothetical protein
LEYYFEYSEYFGKFVVYIIKAASCTTCRQRTGEVKRKIKPKKKGRKCGIARFLAQLTETTN